MRSMFSTTSESLHSKKALLLLLATLTFSGCATVENHRDPLIGLNRASDNFNEIVDTISLKPLAEGYKSIAYPGTRNVVSNFYDNSTYLNTVLNDFLQGKTNQGFSDLFRFLFNSTFGIVGLFDVATSMGLEKHQEDLGQTLAVWGAPQGAYIVYPFFGPNSVRKTPDFITSTATDALFWASFALGPQVTIPLTVLKYIDLRARLLDASGMRDDLALDPYIFTREAWRQNREYLIYDGNPPAKPASSGGGDDWGDDEEWSDEPPADN
jgi:phospholipid-binding lipoprotein MlaA